MKVCSVEGCEGRYSCKGLCPKHYQRLKRTGTTDSNSPRYGNPEESFQARTMPITESGCLAWTGSTNHRGYGWAYDGTKVGLAHRYAWEQANGPVPSGMVIDHLCWVRSCVNVDHMRLVTNAANQQNRRGANRNSASGIRGVLWRKDKGKWAVVVSLGDKRLHGGYFTDKEEAGKAATRLRAERMPYSQN